MIYLFCFELPRDEASKKNMLQQEPDAAHFLLRICPRQSLIYFFLTCRVGSSDLDVQKN